jgi:hypothetical protein
MKIGWPYTLPAVNRVQGVLERANIKLASVIADVLGVSGSGKVRWPAQTRCIRTASFEGVTRGQRAAGMPCEPSRLGLFAPMIVDG